MHHNRHQQCLGRVQILTVQSSPANASVPSVEDFESSLVSHQAAQFMETPSLWPLNV